MSEEFHTNITGGSDVKVPDSILRQAKDVSLPVTVRIGKSGVTDALIVELDGQLSSRSLVKAKVNRGLFERNDLKKYGRILLRKPRVKSFSHGEM